MKDNNKMSLVKITINKNYIFSILNHLSNDNSIFIKKRKIEIVQEDEQERILIEKIILLRKSLETLFKDFNIQITDFLNLKFDAENRKQYKMRDIGELLNQTQESIQFFEHRYHELEQNVSKTIIELENLNLLKMSYEFLDNYNITRDSLNSFNRLKLGIYTTFAKNKENLKTLFEFSEFPNVYQINQITEDRICFFVIYLNEMKKELFERINIIHAEEVPIVKKYFTNDGVNFTRIESELNLMNNTLSKYQKELDGIRADNILTFASLSEMVQNIEQNIWALKQFKEVSSERVALEFFTPISKKKEVIDDIIHNFKEKTIVDSIDIDKSHPIFEDDLNKHMLDDKKFKNELEKRSNLSEDEIKDKDIRNETPTMMRNNFLVRPFETITRMYGTPTYYEIDPTPFIAITFPLIFGLMFGDIGHGLILIIAGLLGAYLFRMKKGTDTYNLCWIIFYCGWGAVLGGALYGEIFGTHELDVFGIIIQTQPITIPILNITLYNPLNNIMTTFYFAVLIGVFHINLGWLIQALNYWKQKRKYLAFSDSITKILLLTGGTILIFVYGFNINEWLSFPYPILLPLVPGILLIILKPLGKAFRVPSLKKESYGELISEGSIETFETLLSVMSNAASYIRLLALALAHISLMLAVRVLVDLIEGEGFLFASLQLIGLIIGNIFVILLEGVLVFLNTMRLHFYEFFFKFFRGSGTEFIPFHLTSQFSVIEFKVEKERDLILEDIEKEIETKKSIEDINKAKSIISNKFL